MAVSSRGSDKVPESRYGLMAKSIQVDGKTIRKLARVRWFLQVVMSMKGSTLKIFIMDMVGLTHKKVTCTKASGKVATNMALAHRHGHLVTSSMKAITS